MVATKNKVKSSKIHRNTENADINSISQRAFIIQVLDRFEQTFTIIVDCLFSNKGTFRSEGTCQLFWLFYLMGQMYQIFDNCRVIIFHSNRCYK